MVAVGLRQLQEEGIGIGVDHLTLESACVAAEVPRSSSHSAWAIDDDYTPQVMYQRTVLKAWLLERENTMFADTAHDALVKLFADPENPPSSSAIVRTSIQAAFKAGYGLQEEQRNDGDFLSTDMALRYAIASQPPGQRDQEISGWLRQGETANRANRIEDSYKPLGTLLRMRPRPEFGESAYELFGIVIASLVEGIGLRNQVLPEKNLDKPLFDVEPGETPPLLIGLCVEAMVPVFFEPVPEDE